MSDYTDAIAEQDRYADKVADEIEWREVTSARTAKGRQAVEVCGNRVRFTLDSVADRGWVTYRSERDAMTAVGVFERELACMERQYRIEQATQTHGIPVQPTPETALISTLSDFQPVVGDRVALDGNARLWTVEGFQGTLAAIYPVDARSATDGDRGGRMVESADLRPATHQTWTVDVIDAPAELWETQSRELFICNGPTLRSGLAARTHRLVSMGDGQIHLVPLVGGGQWPTGAPVCEIRPDDVINYGGRAHRAVVRMGAIEFVPAPQAALYA